MAESPVVNTTGAVIREFWEDDLQMSLVPWLQNAEDASFLRTWLSKLKKRQLAILCSCFGIEGDLPLGQRRAALSERNGHLSSYYLVDRFAYRRSKFAVSDFANTVLPPEIVARCQSGEEGIDAAALLFALYHRDPAHLRTVFHLEKVHTTGFARMKLKGNARAKKKTFKEFLTPEVVGDVLTTLDNQRNDGRVSEFKNIVEHGQHHLLFVRRGERRNLILQGSHAVHGYEPEWIVLDFRSNGKGVDISSVSMAVPLEIANLLASKYFGGQHEYENEIQVNYKPLVVNFLNCLREDKCTFLKLVEVTIKNSPLDGAAGLRLSSDGDESIALSVKHFEKLAGPIMSEVTLIKSVKVLYQGKRVKLLFEAVDGVEDGFSVRYADRALNAPQRAAFVEALGKAPHGLRVLSTEKRHKQ